MTSLTTILGMAPLALGIGEGSAAWAGLAKSVMGGLSLATLLTLYVVPTMYSLLAPKIFKLPPGMTAGPAAAPVSASAPAGK
jgi:HAE1 family hydrophobic/amphiphilic exporter-1